MVSGGEGNCGHFSVAMGCVYHIHTKCALFPYNGN